MVNTIGFEPAYPVCKYGAYGRPETNLLIFTDEYSARYSNNPGCGIELV